MHEDRFRWVDYEGRRILEGDFRNADEKLFLKLLEKELEIVSNTGGGILVLDDATGTTFNHTMAMAAKETTEKEQPYIKKNAIVGAVGTDKVIIRSVNVLASVEHAFFESKDEAVKWLLAD